MVTTFAFPLHVERDDAGLDALHTAPLAERRKKLIELLRDGAHDEHACVTWAWHSINLGTSAITGGIIVLGFGHTQVGIRTGIAGFILGEAQILTQPYRPARCASREAFGGALATARIDRAQRLYSRCCGELLSVSPRSELTLE